MTSRCDTNPTTRGLAQISRRQLLREAIRIEPHVSLSPFSSIDAHSLCTETSLSIDHSHSHLHWLCLLPLSLTRCLRGRVCNWLLEGRKSQWQGSFFHSRGGGCNLFLCKLRRYHSLKYLFLYQLRTIDELTLHNSYSSG